MFSCLRTLFAVLVIGLAMLCPALVVAGVVEDLARDFKPLSGYVVLPVEGEFIIDQDASKGVVAGDLFAVVKPGEKIVHPVTGEVIGSLDKVKGILQVTKVKSGYSYARPLEVAVDAKAGDIIRRFQNMPAAFRDETGRGEGFFAELKEALPALEWQADSSKAVELLFVLQENGLDVRDAQQKALRSYPLPESLAPAPRRQPEVPPAAPAVSVVTAPAIVAAPKPAASPIVRHDATAEEGVWIGPKVEDPIAGVEVGDFDGDGMQEIATAYPHRLEIARLDGDEYATLATVDFGAARKALSLDGADLDGDGRTEFYVTAVFDKELSSLVIVPAQKGYRVEQANVPFYFRRVQLPGEGWVLLGQRMGLLHEDFSGPVFRIKRSGENLLEGDAISLPDNIDLYGFLPLVSSDGQQLFANISTHDRLQMFSAEGEKLWESQDFLGGSEEYIARKDPTIPDYLGQDLAMRYVYLQARLIQGANGEILVPYNEGSRVFSLSRSFKKSQLKAMVWDGQQLREAWHTKTRDGYMADFRLADVDNDGKNEVVTAVVFPWKSFFGKRKSALVVYDLE